MKRAAALTVLALAALPSLGRAQNAALSVVKVDPATANRSYDDNWTRWHVFDPDQKFAEASFQYMSRLQVSMGIMTSAPAYAEIYDGSFVREGR